MKAWKRNHSERVALGVWIWVVLGGCSISRPCKEGGDTSWPTKVEGDAKCFRRQQPDGSIVNDGKYYVYNPDGIVLLEGQFTMGKKHGLWIEYDAKGERVRERVFKNGVELVGPSH